MHQSDMCSGMCLRADRHGGTAKHCSICVDSLSTFTTTYACWHAFSCAAGDLLRLWAAQQLSKAGSPLVCEQHHLRADLHRVQCLRGQALVQRLAAGATYTCMPLSEHSRRVDRVCSSTCARCPPVDRRSSGTPPGEPSPVPQPAAAHGGAGCNTCGHDPTADPHSARQIQAVGSSPFLHDGSAHQQGTDKYCSGAGAPCVVLTC